MSLETADVKIIEDLDDDQGEPSAPNSDDLKQEESAEPQEATLEEQVGNLNMALKEARGLRKAEGDALRRQLGELKNQLGSLQSDKEDSDVESLFEEFSDDDTVTVAGVKRVIAAQKQRSKKMEEDLQSQVGAMLINVSEDLFRTTHGDYDEVVAPFRDLVATDKELVAEITKEGAAKVPERLYRYAKKQIASDEDIQIQKKVADRVTSSQKGPKTSGVHSRGGATRDPSKLTMDDLRKLTPAERDKRWLDGIK